MQHGLRSRKEYGNGKDYLGTSYRAVGATLSQLVIRAGGWGETGDLNEFIPMEEFPSGTIMYRAYKIQMQLLLTSVFLNCVLENTKD